MVDHFMDKHVLHQRQDSLMRSRACLFSRHLADLGSGSWT